VSGIEFVLIPISIDLGLAPARILEGLYVVSESQKRYWVHTVWLCNNLGQIFIYIWTWRVGGSVGALFEGEPTFAGLILSMSTPAIIFLQALALLGQTPSSTQDWTERFYESRTRFFILNAALIIFAGFSSVSYDVVNPVPFAGLLLLNVVALATGDRRAHEAIACIAAVIVALGVGLPILQSA